MIVTRKKMSRRSVLKGLGVAVSLPFLDAMSPAFAASSAAAPLRLAWFLRAERNRHCGTGTPAGDPWPARPTSRIDAAAPAASSRTSWSSSNLTANWGRPLLVGAGDHRPARPAAYMTGMMVQRSVNDLKLGLSADQIAAAAIGKATRLPSLEVGLEEARQTGNCE